MKGQKQETILFYISNKADIPDTKKLKSHSPNKNPTIINLSMKKGKENLKRNTPVKNKSYEKTKINYKNSRSLSESRNKKKNNLNILSTKLIKPLLIFSKEKKESQSPPITKNELINNHNGNTSNKNSKVPLGEINPRMLILRKKRGRLPKHYKKINIIHGANDFDNIERKIQVNFISFLINLANDALNEILGKKIRKRFKHISYENKRSTDLKHTNEIMNFCYKDILVKQVSSKYKRFPDNHNEKTLGKIKKISEPLDQFFDMNYLEIFKKFYYNNRQPLSEVNFNEAIKFKVSKKTKGFYYFLQKNKDGEAIINKVLSMVYFNRDENIEDRCKANKEILNYNDDNILNERKVFFVVNKNQSNGNN